MKNAKTIFRSSSIVYHPSSIIHFVAAVLFLCACPTMGVVEFNDGLTHDIDYQINDTVWVDYQTPLMYTTVNWLDGASMSYPPSKLQGFEDSRINIRGGSIDYLRSYDSSQVNISGGSIGILCSYHTSQIDISSGSIGAYLLLSNQSKIQIFGSDFAVDEVPFGYGELISILGGSYGNEPWRHLTGTLLSGELIDTGFQIGQDARIILIPEPATVLLLGLGGLVLRKRH